MVCSCQYPDQQWRDRGISLLSRDSSRGHGSLVTVLVSAALLGVIYMMLAGAYLVWGVKIYSDRPAIGLGLPFLMIAVGQVIGAPVAGALMEATTAFFTFSVFASVALVTMAAAYRPEPEQHYRHEQQIGTTPRGG